MYKIVETGNDLFPYALHHNGQFLRSYISREHATWAKRVIDAHGNKDFAVWFTSSTFLYVNFCYSREVHDNLYTIWSSLAGHKTTEEIEATMAHVVALMRLA